MLTGQNLIQADRMWRNPEMRELFEQETGHRPGDGNYDEGFRNWAEDMILRKERCPYSTLSGPGGQCGYPDCASTCQGRA